MFCFCSRQILLASAYYKNLDSRAAGMFCGLQVAGWNLIVTGKLLALRRNVQAVDLPWLLHDAVYDRSVWLLPPNADLAEAMVGGYIPMILGLQWIVSFEETSEISSEIAAEFGFFPVITKMKAQWACMC